MTFILSIVSFNLKSYIIMVDHPWVAQCFFFTMDEVVWPEEGADVTPFHTVRGSRLQVNEQGPGNVFTTWNI